MFSQRLFAIFALFAAVATVPATDKPVPRSILSSIETDLEDPFPWGRPFGNFSLTNFLNSIFKQIPSIEEIKSMADANNSNFRVIIDVKNFKKDNLKVKVKGDSVLINGWQKAKPNSYATQLMHSYVLPQKSRASAVTATLTSDQYLVVDAPIDVSASDKNKDATTDRDVPIVESGKPLFKSDSRTATDADNVVTTPQPTKMIF